MNTYKKYCPNVFLAKCIDTHKKGDVIMVTTKYGKQNEHIVFNRIGTDNEGNFYYSIIRADGYNIQERAKQKASRYKEWSESASKKSHKKWEESHEGKDFLALAEPIKIGHHSEKRHRALIERNHKRMDKSMELLRKSEEHDLKAEYWESKSNEINLSMPESLEYFEYRLEEAKIKHEGLKNGTIERRHSYSLTYAKKDVNQLTKKLNKAKILWGE